jgi:hypothetical protein
MMNKWLVVAVLVLLGCGAAFFVTFSPPAPPARSSSTAPAPPLLLRPSPATASPKRRLAPSSNASCRPIAPAALAFGCKCHRSSSDADPLPLDEYFDCDPQVKRCEVRIAFVGDSHIRGFNATTRDFNDIFYTTLRDKILARHRACARSSAAADESIPEEDRQQHTALDIKFGNFALGRAGLTSIAPIRYQTKVPAARCAAFRPHIIVMAFGTNDAPNLPFVGRSQFLHDYRSFLAYSFMNKSAKPKRTFLTLVLTPPTVVEGCFAPMWCALVNRSILQDEVVPALRAFVKQPVAPASRSGAAELSIETRLVDWNRYMLTQISKKQRSIPSVWYQWDGMHLSEGGSLAMADFAWRETCAECPAA